MTERMSDERLTAIRLWVEGMTYGDNDIRTEMLDEIDALRAELAAPLEVIGYVVGRPGDLPAVWYSLPGTPAGPLTTRSERRRSVIGKAGAVAAAANTFDPVWQVCALVPVEDKP